MQQIIQLKRTGEFMKNVLVTGANGFIGKCLITKLIADGINVTAVVRKTFDDEECYSGQRLSVVYCDLGNIESLAAQLDKEPVFDAVYHLAWGGTSGDARADYSVQCNNIKYTLDVIELAARLKIKRFIGAGSMAEWDNLAYLPVDGATPNGVAMYGAAKIAAHYMSKIECNKLGIEHVWGIFSNIYGVGDDNNNFVNFASKIMLDGKRPAFTKGEQNYDFVYISDFVNGLYLMGEKGKNNSEYFIGSGKPRQLKEYVKLIRDAVDKDITLYMGEIPFNGISVEIEKLSIEKMERDTGYQAEVDFETGIAETVKWLRTKKL